MNLESEILILKTLTANLLDRVYQLEAENAQLRPENSLLLKENTSLKAEVLELKARLSKNSHNSSKPPSSDGYAKSKPAIPKGSQKSAGGQVGHKGKTLEMTAHPDEIVKHHALLCMACLSKLSEKNIIDIASKHQVFDLPVQKLLVTEHQLLVSQCSCGCKTKATLPPYLAKAPAQYGPNIQSLAVYLNSDFKIPFQKIGILFKDLYGYSFNQATALNANERAYECLEPIENQIKEQITLAKVAHADETGIRCNGLLQWLHVTSSDLFTYFFIHSKRGGLAIDSAKSILHDCKNYLMHDCWSPYFSLPKATHLICNAHLIRELQALIEQDSHWACKMQKFLLALFETSKQQILPKVLIPKYVKEFHQICQLGYLEEPPPAQKNGQPGRIKKSKGRNLLERLSTNQDAILSFAFHEDIPFTNNQAERDLRTIKTKQKVSACFRAISGAEHYARIQGFISTMRKNGLNPFEQLKFALQNQFQWQTC